MDHAVLFVGPTLSAETARALLDAEIRPPARRGDIYMTAVDEPRAILLIDGAFEDVPAPFHKEILWALSQGVHVFGASSIGALRAAELDGFGMVGIGEVYRAYRSGRLERDDLVAVLHGPAELGYPVLTTAFVDIEAAMLEAERQGVISQQAREGLCRSALSLFWRERTVPNAVAAAKAAGSSSSEAEALTRWIAANDISQKRSDAIALLRHVAERWDELAEPFQPAFRFEETAAWQRLQSEMDGNRFGLTAGQSPNFVSDRALDPTYSVLELEAALALLAADFGVGRVDEVDSTEFHAAALRFRKARGLTRTGDVLGWLQARGFSHSDYVTLVRQMQVIEATLDEMRSRLPTAMARIHAADSET